MERLLLSEAITAAETAERLFRILSKRTPRPMYKAMTFILDTLNEQAQAFQYGSNPGSENPTVLTNLAAKIKNG